MEALTPDFLKFLNRELPQKTVINALVSNGMLTYYQAENRLRRDIQITYGEDFDFYIQFNRRSAFTDFDRAISGRVRPYVSFNLYGVPLVSIYQSEQAKLKAAAKQKSGNAH
jgi:hypothetical protein